MELSSCQKHGAKQAAGQTPGICSTALPVVKYKVQHPEMKKEQFPLWQHPSGFFLSSFLSLSEFTCWDDAFAQSIRMCASQPGQSPANPPVSNCTELLAQLAHTPCLALGAAARFAVTGFMTCYISTFNEGWVGASSFH